MNKMATPGQLKTPGQLIRQGYISAIRPPQPLTAEEAKQLVEASNISPDFAGAKEDIAETIVQVSQTDDPRKRRPFDALLDLAM